MFPSIRIHNVIGDKKMEIMKRRKNRRKMRILLNIGMCVFAATFVIGGIIVGKTLIEDGRADRSYVEMRQQMQTIAYQNSVAAESLSVQTEARDEGENTQSYVRKESEMDFSVLREISPDTVAWLRSEGSVIDYPVLHTDNNEFYLSHLHTGEKNRMGSLFVDYRNTGVFTDKNTVIYGHNMKSGAMFHSLSEYKAQDYYDEFPVMRLYTPDGDYTVELFSGTVEDGNYEFVRFDFEDDASFMEYVNSFRSRSTFTSDVVVNPMDQIVTLCTCSYEQNNARYVVMGRLTQAN